MALIFDRFHARAQCFVGLLAALTIFERHLVKQSGESHPLTTYDDILAAAFRVPTDIRIPGGELRFLDAYLQPFGSKRRAEFSGKNADDVTPLMFGFIRGFIGTRLGVDGSPIGRAAKGELGTPSDHKFAKRIVALSEANSDLNLIGTPEKVGRDHSLEDYLKATLGPVPKELRHPDYQSLGLLDLRALKVEFHGIDRSDIKLGATWGLFAIVREPRGWAAEKIDHVNLLVRDVLWVSPHKLAREAFHGFYASVMDDCAFVIDDLHEDETAIIAHGTLKGPFRSSQRTRVVFAPFEQVDPLEITHGVVAGTAGDGTQPTFAAWKALVVNPNWNDLARLEGLLYQLNHEQNETAYDVLRNAGAIGLLFSTKLREKFPDVQERREVFRTLIASDPSLVAAESEDLGHFLTRDLESRLKSAALEFKAAGTRNATDSAMVDALMKAVQGYVKSHWHLIEPAQVIMFKAPRRRRGALPDARLRSAVATLIDRTTIGDASSDTPDS